MMIYVDIWDYACVYLMYIYIDVWYDMYNIAFLFQVLFCVYAYIIR
jgi:hypothetical protein